MLVAPEESQADIASNEARGSDNKDHGISPEVGAIYITVNNRRVRPAGCERDGPT